jgi:hypothetical protein
MLKYRYFADEPTVTAPDKPADRLVFFAWTSTGATASVDRSADR